ncbi:HNH endonuclease signature motif containing protein [Dactylosporangium sp. McL0621]|uniref:HNH endonuclease signature motif containing protein n=1 Tax=Dactylosporangium sp. McL0621 TaxID=3415678 RepID=UPI003CFAF65A
MPDGRPRIPAELEREVKMETGLRCAIPFCRQHPIEIAHIVPWAEVREHRYENLIALCANCHTRFDRGEIDRKMMKQYKANLGIVNARYGEYERRLLEFFATRHRVSLKAFRLAEQNGGAAAWAEKIAQQGPEAEADETRYVWRWFAETGIPLYVTLPAGLEFLMSRLVLDGCIIKLPATEIGVVLPGGFPLVEVYVLTEPGVTLVEQLIAAEPLDA